MKQVIKVRVLPNKEEAAVLMETLHKCNAAAAWLSEVMLDAHVFRKIDTHQRFYFQMREMFGLAAQPTIRVIGKVSEAYAARMGNAAAGNYGPPGSERRRRIEKAPISFRPRAAQPFDARCLSWQFPEQPGRDATVSIWTVAGRLKSLPIIGDPKQLSLLRTRAIGETDLIVRDGKWFLHATVEAPEAPLADPTNGFIGVDMGIVNTSLPPVPVRTSLGRG